jgi:sorbitol-specific phosphotransferase system component IIA
LDVFDRNLPVLDRQQIAQGFACELNGDFFLVEARVGQDFAQCAFELAHVGAHVLGDEECHFFGHLGPFGACLVDQDGDAHFELGRLDGHREPGVEA